MRLWVSAFAARGEIFFVADVDHPEVSADDADGTVIVCHPSDEPVVRDLIARIGEERDVGRWATDVRRRVAAARGA